jgi:hypothetical protein
MDSLRSALYFVLARMYPAPLPPCHPTTRQNPRPLSATQLPHRANRTLANLLFSIAPYLTDSTGPGNFIRDLHRLSTLIASDEYPEKPDFTKLPVAMHQTLHQQAQTSPPTSAALIPLYVEPISLN